MMATFKREEADKQAPARAKYTPAQRAFIKSKFPQTVFADDDEPAPPAKAAAAEPKAEKKKTTKKRGMFS